MTVEKVGLFYDVEDSRASFSDEEEADAFAGPDEGKQESELDFSDEEAESSSQDSETELTAWQKLQIQRMSRKHDDSDVVFDRGTVSRRWRSSFTITHITNTTSQVQNIFLVIGYGHKNRFRKNTIMCSSATAPKQIDNNLSESSARYMYSPLFTLPGNSSMKLTDPLVVWMSKSFSLKLCEMEDFAVSIEVWEHRKLTYNSYLGAVTVTFKQILENSAIASYDILRGLQSIQRIQCLLSFTETNKFRVTISNARVEYESSSIGQVGKDSAELPSGTYQLTFDIPSTAGKRVKTTSNLFSPQGGIKPVEFLYHGTLSEFENEYIRIDMRRKRFNGLYNEWSYFASAMISLNCVLYTPSVSVKLMDTEATTAAKFIKSTFSADVLCAKLPYGSDKVTAPKQSDDILVAFKNSLDSSEIYSVTQPDPHSLFFYLAVLNTKYLYLVINPISIVCQEFNSDSIKLVIAWDNMKFTSMNRGPAIFPIRLLGKNYVRENNIESRMKVGEFGILTAISDKYATTILPLDIRIKGDICITAYSLDDNIIGTGCVNLAELNNGIEEKRSLLGQYISSKAAEAPEAANAFENSFCSVEFRTKVRNIQNQALENMNTSIRSAGLEKVLVTFDMFTIPSLPSNISIPRGLDRGSALARVYRTVKYRWDKDAVSWNSTYRSFYRKSERLDWYPGITKTNTGTYVPISSYLSPVCSPKGLNTIGRLFYFVCLIPFDNSDNMAFTQLSNFMLRRKGNTIDHSNLLCSFLLGLGYDAYVAIGALNDTPMNSHSWVITRNTDNSVTFWDTLYHKVFTLPKRFGYDYRIPVNVEDDIQDGYVKPSDVDRNYSDGRFLCDFYNRMAINLGFHMADYPLSNYSEESLDAAIEEFEQKLYQNIANFVDDDHTEEDNETISDEPLIISHLCAENIAIAPVPELQDPHVWSFVLYSVINVMYNHDNVYRNLQNHDPTAIYYDVESPYQWAQLYAESDIRYPMLDHQLNFQASASMKYCETISAAFKAEVEDVIVLLRNKIGLKVQLETNDEVMDHITKYLDLQEFRNTLDPRCDPGPNINSNSFSNILNRHIKQNIARSFNASEILESIEAKEPYPPNQSGAMANKDISVSATSGNYHNSFTLINTDIDIETIKVPQEQETLKTLNIKIHNSKSLPRITGKRTKEDIQDSSFSVETLTGHGMYKPISNYDDPTILDIGIDEHADAWETELRALEENNELGANQEYGNGESSQNDMNSLQHQYSAQHSGSSADRLSPEEYDELMRLISSCNSGLWPYHHRENVSRDPDQRMMWKQEIEKWQEYYSLEEVFYTWQQSSLPIKRMSVFTGFPCHFREGDSAHVKKLLMESKKVLNLIENKTGSPTYTVVVSSYPHVGGYITTWLFFGVTVPHELANA